MPGIAGIASVSRDEPVEPVAKAMAAVMRARDRQTVYGVAAPGAAMASTTCDGRIDLDQDGECLLAVCGFLPEIEEVAGHPARTLLARYRERGVDALCGLNGLYVIAVWDGRDSTLHLVTDRYGFTTLYYWHDGDRLLFASELKAIAQAPGFVKSVRARSVVDFLQLTYVLDDYTLMEGIRLAPAGSVVTFRGGQLATRCYWAFTPKPDPAGAQDDRAYCDRFVDVFRKAVLQRVRGKCCLMMSGGYDSRMVAVVLAEAGLAKQVDTLTLGYPGCLDERYGRQVTRRLGMPHTFIPVGLSFLADHAETCAVRLDAAVSVHSAWAFEANPYLEAHGFETVLQGFLGDAVASIAGGFGKKQTVIQDDEESYRRFLAHTFASTFNDADLATLLSDETKQQFIESAAGESATTQRLHELFAAAPGATLRDRADALNIRVRQRMFTRQQMEVYEDVARVAAPFTDNALVELTQELPKHLRLHGTLQRLLFKHHFTSVRDIPHPRWKVPPAAPRHVETYWRARNKLYYNILPKLSLGAWRPLDQSRWVLYDEALRTGSRSVVDEMLAHAERLEPFVNMDAVRRTVEDHCAGRINAYGKLCALLTLSLWRKSIGV